MTFDEYQTKALSTALYMNKVEELFPNLPTNIYKTLEMSYVSLGLGEVGEVQNKVKKIIRDHGGVLSDDMRNSIIDELSDCMWYIANMCELLGTSMHDVAEYNIAKLFSRKERGVLTGSGDKR